MRAPALLILCLTLAACASPRAICERDALHDLRVVDALIAETEQTLARGYGLERRPYTRPRLELCHGTGLGEGPVAMSFCTRTETAYRDRPVAIDPAAERRKLAALTDRRARLARAAARDLAACRVIYPQG